MSSLTGKYHTVAPLSWSGVAVTHQTAHPGRAIHYEVIYAGDVDAYWEVTVWDGGSLRQPVARLISEGSLEDMCARAKTAAELDWQKRSPRWPLSFQDRVYDWVIDCFGYEIARDTVERNHRFLEEALELVQSLGCTRSEAHQLVDYVFDRPVGQPTQEAGGALVTLAALLRAAGIGMNEAGEIELARVYTKVEAIRAKQAAKPKHSPLPQTTENPTLVFPPELTDELRDALSTMLWTCGHIARVLRLDGQEIKTRAEDEQAHVLHWFISMVLIHGEEWHEIVTARLKEIVARHLDNDKAAEEIAP